MPFRRKLALIVGVPSLVALLGSLLALSRVVASYHRAQVLEEANASSTSLIQAAAIQAKERGFTAAALADPQATTAKRMIAELRLEGDRQLDSALQRVRGALPDNAVLAAAFDTLRDARRQRDLKRSEVDAALAHDQRAEESFVQGWFDTQTRLIAAERAFGGTLFLAQNPYELVIQYNGSIKANVFEASEFAGRERARIGRFIASGQPIPPERLDELQRWRGVVEQDLAAIAQLRANPAMAAPVLASIDQMEAVFLGDYQTVRTAVYAASERHEPYPLTTDEWIKASTQGIDSILAVSARIGDEAARISHTQAAFSLANVLLILGMMALLGLAVVAAGFVARHLTRRLRELRAGAERVSQGDYSQPVSDANDLHHPAGDEFAELAGVFNTMQDKVEAKVQERTGELSAANERLRVLNVEKDTFLGICSHDLKNPLSGIIGLAGLLEADAEDPEQVRGHAADILRSSEYMFHLISNLLDLGAIEQGRLNQHPIRFDLGTTISRVVETYRQRAADKHIALRWSASAAAVYVFADAEAITQVADNLISNALKFTPLGGTVEVRIDDALSNDKVCLRVRDTGPGLSATDQAKLFGKYVRLSAQATAGEHSTGLGLSIVKKLVEAMGGTVSCESTMGHGCTFTVKLPAAAENARPGPEARADIIH